eukprot:511968-Pleurochrysis_carterae.AAC.3
MQPFGFQEFAPFWGAGRYAFSAAKEAASLNCGHGPQVREQQAQDGKDSVGICEEGAQSSLASWEKGRTSHDIEHFPHAPAHPSFAYPSFLIPLPGVLMSRQVTSARKS